MFENTVIMMTTTNIKLIINHAEEYAAREIITAYLPKIKIEVTDSVPAQGDYVQSTVTETNGEFEYFAKVRIGDKISSAVYRFNDMCKTHVKRCVAKSLRDITGFTLPWGLITGIRPSKLVREMEESGMKKGEILSRLQDFYECSSQKANLAVEVAENEREILLSMPSGSISLYVGIPFCPTRCLYCSFTSQSIKFSNKLTEPYMDALEKEISYTADLIAQKGLSIDTVYIGGGTPTALSEKQLDRLLGSLCTKFDFGNIREFTLEAGRPDTITDEKLSIAANYGISRISINPQSMNQKTLDIIGRSHSPEDIIRTFEMAKKRGFGHINTDIIAGLPEETPNDFSHTMDEIEKLNPESVTVHTMSIKHGSYLDKEYSMYTSAVSDTVNTMLECAAQRLNSLGKHPYYMYRQKNMLGNLENVGYCNTGHECLYNIYIMEEVQSIYALGAGASTKIIDGNRIDRIFNVKEVSEYIKRIDEMLGRKDILKSGNGDNHD